MMRSPSKLALLHLSRLAELSLDTAYARTRGDYLGDLYSIANRYVTRQGSTRTARAEFTRAINVSLEEAFWKGYTQAGGDYTSPSREAYTWLQGKIAQEVGFARELFDRMRSSAAVPNLQPWALTLDRVYATGRILAEPRAMLTFVRVRPSDYCDTCKRYENKKHTAGWWFKHNLIPGPGMDTECGGFQCAHELVFSDNKTPFVPVSGGEQRPTVFPWGDAMGLVQGPLKTLAEFISQRTDHAPNE